MSHPFITNETLEELFTKLRFAPNRKARLKVREIINSDLQAGATSPDDVAEEIIEFLEIESDFKPDIVEALNELYIFNSKSDFEFFPDNH